MTNTTYDFCIVGAGSCGGLVARELAEQGFKVAVLEAGPLYRSRVDFVNDEAEMLKLLWNEPRVLTGKHPIGPLSGQGVGGGGLVWLGVTPRFHDSDFETYTRDGVGADWPIRSADLAPYYSIVERDFGVAGINDNPFEPPRELYPMPPHRMSWLAQTLARGARAVGATPLVAPLAINSIEYDGRPACTYCGWCFQGCPTDAKASSLATYIPKALARGARLMPNAFVHRIAYDAAVNRVTGVEYLDSQGDAHRVAAQAVVISAHAYETPRLLLLSANGTFPEGLANSSGLVGKNFMTHPNYQVSGRFPEPVNGFKGIPMGQVMVQDWYETDPRAGYARGFQIVSFGTLPYCHALIGPDFFGDELKQFINDYRHIAGWWICAEGLPNDRSTITLDPELRDARGLPVARLTHEWVDNDIAVLEAARRKSEELLWAAGVEEVYAGVEYAAHPMGTCRMGADPATSVVNDRCQSHDIPNLFVCDTSVFVTGGAVNSTLTAMALARRAVDYMGEAARRGDL
jgi:choline dehydrogenase-like flavoprotein